MATRPREVKLWGAIPSDVSERSFPMRCPLALALLTATASLVLTPSPAWAGGEVSTVLAPAPRPTETVATVNGGATTPGEKRTYEATLKTKAGAPVANRKVTFRIEGKNGLNVVNGGITMGEATTDAEGRARVTYTTPELIQAGYALKVSFAGDHEMTASNAESNLFVAKAVVKLNVTDPNASEPGSSTFYIGIILWRLSDGKGIDKPIVLTVNGKARTLTPSGSHIIFLEPLDASSWKVKIEFAGDAANLPVSFEKTYQRPK